MNFIAKIFDSNEKQIEKLRPVVAKINALEPEFQKLSEEQIKGKTHEFKESLAAGKETTESLIPRAFALVREAGRRTLGMRHFDVQLLAGMVLHEGKIAEQKTGEGKTLTATLPLYLNSLEGLGGHIVTPNDYLSRHGAGWMGPIYHALGVSVGVIIHEQAFLYDPEFTNETFLDEYSKRLRPVSRREAYTADVVYGTNNEFGFDYLRDNMVYDISQAVQTNPRGDFGAHHFAIVDEVDSILIDEARTPLIISAPAEESTEKYYEFARLASRLTAQTDYTVDEKHKTSHLTELGIVKIEGWLGVSNLYEKDFQTVHHIEQALKARALFVKDKDYVVKEGEVIIVDEFTGRLMFGRRYSDGLHQAIEAKEGVAIQRESRTLATVSFQNYFRLYQKLSGMTGTAVTEAEEFYKIYKLDVVVIPTHKPMVRQDLPDVVYKTESAKYRAIVNSIEEHYRRGQPVLVGTTSIEKNELLHSLLERKEIPHQVLNAKYHEKEALIIAQSGRRGAVTLATNMAGRGVDIILGGDPAGFEDPEIRNSKFDLPAGKVGIRNSEEWKKDHDEVVGLGGLAVIGTERHESRRIDNQLRGRTGRQGDPGSSRFFVSLQDDLMRIFGGEMVEKLMDRLGLDENIPIENSLVSGSIQQSQKKVEGYNFDVRKQLVEYDDVMNSQREVVYKLRRKILEGNLEQKDWLLEKVDLYKESFAAKGDPRALYFEAEKRFGEPWRIFVKQMSLQVIDTLWIEHLDNMDDLREGIGLRGYGGIDPLVEYKREGHALFSRLVDEIYGTIGERIVQAVTVEPKEVSEKPESAVKDNRLVYRHDSPVQTGSPVGRPAERDSLSIVNNNKVGRNDPCPCGAKKSDGTPIKYKHCHGK
ncbi:MAG: preprotein translocase subunit SecA [Patescibacteria group bacterium]|nr:preprotein translocase subunit SecA [Patescibacteria group bacterium]